MQLWEWEVCFGGNDFFAEIFRNEGMTHQPLVNLVSRIKEQGLIDDVDITSHIMFNPQVVIRKKAKIDKVERTFPVPGYLYVERSARDIYTYGTTVNKRGEAKRPRFFILAVSMMPSQ